MKQPSFKTASHAVMLAFALASLDNVHRFFAHAGHDGVAAWALAGALGAALLVLSIMLTHIGRSKSTVNSYLKELEEAGRIFVNGSVQVLS